VLSTRARDLACIGRYLGDAAALLGDREAAKTYYEQGLAVCQRARFRPEIALIRLGLAEVLLDEAGDGALTLALSQRERERRRAEALAHLDFAIDEFRAMKMHPSLERALRHKGLLRA
jgi:tetratricopeptide (TPR) repeat protein